MREKRLNKREKKELNKWEKIRLNKWEKIQLNKWEKIQFSFFNVWYKNTSWEIKLNLDKNEENQINLRM